MLHVTRSYLEARARVIGAPPIAVLIFAWTPWIGLIGFWFLLVVHAVVDFA